MNRPCSDIKLGRFSLGGGGRSTNDPSQCPSIPVEKKEKKSPLEYGLHVLEPHDSHGWILFLDCCGMASYSGPAMGNDDFHWVQSPYFAIIGVPSTLNWSQPSDPFLCRSPVNTCADVKY